MEVNKKILVVDDVESIRTSLINILETMGIMNITQAASGNAAWGMINQAVKEEEPFDLILSDINMKDGNGIGLLRKVKDSPAVCDTPFLLISTLNEKDVIMDAIRLGVTNYIIKPFDSVVIREKIDFIFD